jgi:hypothetical protein
MPAFPGMPTYLLELYVPRSDAVDDAAARARQVAAAAARPGVRVRYLRSLYLADDETCFHVFEAPSREAVADAAHRVGLTDARVTEAVEPAPDA